MKCAEIRELLPAYAGEQQPGLAVRRHLASCSACRSELAYYKEIESGLGAMRSAVVEVPPHLSAKLVAVPETQTVAALLRGRAASAKTHVARNRAAYVGGAVAVAGALGATLWRVRSRRPATA